MRSKAFATQSLGSLSGLSLTRCCAWDEDWRPSWRVKLIPSYKSHRLADDGHSEEMEPDLKRQLPWIRLVLKELGLNPLGIKGYEADDILASAVKNILVAILWLPVIGTYSS